MTGRLRYLAISMVLFFFVYPFMEGSFAETVLLNLFVSAICLFGIYAVSEQRRHLIVALILATPWLGTTWLSMAMVSEVKLLALVSAASAALFYGFTAAVILGFVLRSKRVSDNVLYGAVCIYMLIGGTFSMVFALVEGLQPGSFQTTSNPDQLLAWHDFFYYSYATLTTLGYGDIVPMSTHARAFAVLEAIMGVMYLAIVISRLVGSFITQSSHRSHPGDGV